MACDVPMCRVVCAWCGQEMGAAACLPHQVNEVSHGICDACRDRELSGSSSPASEACAGVQAPAGRNHLDAAAALVPPGTSAQDNGTAGSAGVMSQQPSDEHARACPAASFTLLPIRPERPAPGLVEFVDRMIKSVVTGGRMDE